MAEIDLGKVKGEDGQGGGLTIGEKIFLIESSYKPGCGVWYRYLSKNVIEFAAEYIAKQVTIGKNTSFKLGELPEGARPKASIMNSISQSPELVMYVIIYPSGLVNLTVAGTDRLVYESADLNTRLVYSVD